MIQSLAASRRMIPRSRNFCEFIGKKIVQLEPGLLVVKGALSPVEQIALSKIALTAIESLRKTDENELCAMNSASHRGRMHGAMNSLPPLAGDLCRRSIELGAKTDRTIKVHEATHLILHYYKTLAEPPCKAFIPWNQENKKDDSTVVVFNIGDSCDFLINRQKPKIDSASSLSNPANLAHRVLFQSGDALIFGGPCRYFWNAVYKIHKNTAPSFLPFQDARLNFTFRHIPKTFGDKLSKDI